jgi:hypothetical protein
VSALTQVPAGVREAVARNILNGPKWVLVNADSSPPVVVSHGDLSHAEWLDAFKAIKAQAEESL